MPDLFKEKASDWDANEFRSQLSSAIGSAILEYVPLDEKMTVMDFGAGTGLLTSHVTPRVKSIAAVDISAAMLDKLVAKPEFQAKVIAICQDIVKLPLESQYDLIVSAMAMHHVKDTAKLLATFSKHLKPGGRIALADLDQEDGTFHEPGTDGVYHYGFARDDLEQIIEKNGFSDIYFHTAHTVERHSKSFSIFLVVATKT